MDRSDGDGAGGTHHSARWVGLSPALGSDLVAFAVEHVRDIAMDAWFDGAGEVAEPTIDVATETGERVSRALAGVWDLVSLRGVVGHDGAANLHALVAREGATGPQLLGGLLRAGRVVRVDLLVCTADGASPTVSMTPPRVEERRSAPGVMSGAPRATPSSPGSPMPPLAMSMPRRPQVAEEVLEVYPEEGDTVNHFAFGHCTVVFSDGERIRLQQEKDGRVREVALSMLRIDAPTASGDKRHWDLRRKN